MAGLRAAGKNTTYVTFIESKADCPERNRDNTDVLTQPHVMVDSERFDEIFGFTADDPHKTRLAQLSMARMIRSKYIASS